MSPIVGITDQIRLPRIGKLHLGEKKQGARGEYPSPVPYFLVRESETTPANAVEAFKAVYGDEPTELHIQFPTNDPEDWADQYLRYYTQSYGLTCRGTGETAEAKIDPVTGKWATAQSKTWEYRTLTVCGDACPLAQERRCKPVMRLSFLLRDVPGLGIWQIDTSSVNSMRNVNGMVELVRRLNDGRIAFFPFILLRHQVTVQPKGEKAKSVYIVDLRPDGLLTIGQAQALLEGKGEVPAQLLPAKDEDEVPEDLFPNGDESEVVEEAGEAPTDSEPELPGDLRSRLLAADEVDEEKGEMQDLPAGKEPESVDWGPSSADAENFQNRAEPTPQFKTVGQLLNACRDQFNLKAPAVYSLVGKKGPEDFADHADLDDAWERVCAAQAGK